MEEAERNHLLARIENLERARRRWRAFALIVTPVLGVLFVLALANAITASLTLRERVMQERRAAEDALREAQDGWYDAEEALLRSRRAAEAYERAAKLLEPKATEPSP